MKLGDCARKKRNADRTQLHLGVGVVVGGVRKEEAECRSNAARETRAAAQELHGMGLALQQIGDILGVSRQRAHQLVNA